MWLRFAALVTLLGAPSIAAAQDWDDGAPDVDWVYEDGYELEGVATQQDFYRQRARSGYRWVGGQYVDGVWVRPHWVPTKKRADAVWVRGHVGVDGYWVPGHWRMVSRDGYEWVAGYRADAGWVAGFWRPIAKKCISKRNRTN